jgi:hypothetical protein
VYAIAPVSNASRYVWVVPEGATITSGQGSTSITVNYGASFASGNIVVAAANSCGQSSSLNPRTLFVNGAPAAPSAISGQTIGLCSKTNVTYSIGGVAGASNYTWTVPAGVTINSGQGTTTLSVNFSSTFVSGNICVMAGNSCGSSSNTCIAVSGKPAAVGLISGLASVCAKQKNVTYSVSPVEGATSYTWTVPSQSIITSGQGTTSIVVTFASKGGNVTVTAKNSCGSTTRSLAVNVVTCSKTNITTSERQLMAEEITPNSGTGLTAYPNPTKDIVQLMFLNVPDGVYTLSVYDGVGKAVRISQLTIRSNRAVTNLNGFAKGVYLLNVSTGKKNWSVKVVRE